MWSEINTKPYIDILKQYDAKFLLKIVDNLALWKKENGIYIY